MIPLRDYQERCIADVREAFRAGARAPLLVSPTGSGKTVIFGYVASQTSARGNSALILAHRKELIKQASRKLSETKVDHGIISRGFTPNNSLVQVASVATLARRDLDRYQHQLIVPDEAHHCVAGQWDKIIKAQPKAKLLGVTATPERFDGKGLGIDAGGCFDCLVLGPSIAELTKQGYLCPTRIYAPAYAPDLSGVRTEAGDYAKADLAERMNVATITGDVVAHWFRITPGLSTIAFCVNVQHAENVAATFRAAGVRSECVHGDTKRLPTPQRDARIAGLQTGAVQVLTACDLISEGLDIPGVSVVILLRSSKSLSLVMQQIGRGFRPVYAPGFDLSTALGRRAAIAASDKPYLTILDHAGCTAIHGLPDTPREWSLDGRKKGEKPPPTWQCPKCYAIQRPARVCVACAYAAADPAKPGQGQGRIIMEMAGELVEVDPARIEQIRRARWNELLTGRETKQQLQEIALARGYRPAWVEYTLRDQGRAA